MVSKGFKFGMLLQFAIGPVCLFIFQLSLLNGFYIGETGVLGVTLVDGIFIMIAIIGVATIMDKKNVKVCLKVFGSVILLIFGFSTILNQFNIEFIPSLSIHHMLISNNAFISAIIITSSSPLTIIFWAGIFSTKVTERNVKKQDIYSFAFGALLSTIFFLSLINLMGSFIKVFLPTNVIQILNIIAGFLLICFSIKLLCKKN